MAANSFIHAIYQPKSQEMTIKEAAHKYYESGFRVIPVDDKKRPACGSWKGYVEKQTKEDIDRLFSGNPYGIAILTGVNGLEVIDIDQKYDLTDDIAYRYMRLNDEVNDNSVPFTSLCLIETTSGGFHVLYRCPTPGGNKKLASRPATEEEQAEGDTVKALIETRGVGGYAVAYPTPGYTIQHGDIFNLPTITQQQRLDLIRAAKHFDEVVEPAPVKIPKEYKQTKPTGNGLTPWDDFNQSSDGVDILLSHGWTRVYEDSQRIYLKRPGNTTSKMSGNWHKQKEIFICHSTSTTFEPGKGYSTYGIYTVLEHNGDFSKSASELYKQGFGGRLKPDNKLEAPGIQARQAKDQLDADLAYMYSTKFDVTAPIVEEKATLFQHHEGKVYKVAGPGMMVGVVGPRKSSKTSVVAAIVASALSRKSDPILTFNLNVEGKNIVYFDTEQSGYFYKRTQAMIHELAGKYDRR